MKYYKRVDPNGKTTTVENYSHDAPVEGAVEITKKEYQAFLDSLPPPPTPVDWAAIYAAAKNDSERVNILAKRLGLIS